MFKIFIRQINISFCEVLRPVISELDQVEMDSGFNLNFDELFRVEAIIKGR